MTNDQIPMTKRDKEEALEKLHREIEKLDLPLKTAASRLVPGEGNPDAEVVFVGEAPGAEEDKQGRPFVGAAGKFLNQLIEGIGPTFAKASAGKWKREDFFITNLIKHRPPNNRDPLPIEIEAYTPWLDKQIEIIQPKLIVTLGRYSMAYFLGEGLSITKIHGQPKRKNDRVVMPMYHPAAALYRGDLRPVLAADFKKIPKVLEMITSGKVKENKEEEQPAVAEASAGKQKSLL